MLKRVGLPSVFLYYHTLGITLPTATAATTATWNGIAFGGPILQIRFTRSITHSHRGKKGAKKEGAM